MSTKRTLAILLVVAFLIPGCATLFTGTSDEITFETEPAGARVFVDGIDYGVTPATMDITRSGIGDREIMLRLDGYEPYTFKLNKEFNAVSVINIFFWPGFIVDVATGAVTRYRPLGYIIDLRPEGRVHRLDALPRDDAGRYLLPDGQERVVVQDAELGLKLVFER